MIALLLASLTGFAAAAEPAGAWTRVSDADGILLESQPVAGSAFGRLRATLTIDAPADVVLVQLWGDGSLRKGEGNVSSREVLLDKPDERITYETASAPLISTRDYVMRYVRKTDAQTGRRLLTFNSIDHPARPPREGVVRLSRIEGSTVIEPLPGRSDACRLVHVVFSEPGGSIPAWVASQGQRNAITSSMKDLRARATRTVAR